MSITKRPIYKVPGSNPGRRINYQEDIMATLQQAAEQVYPKCDHKREDGTSALMNQGKEKDGLSVCIICGEPVFDVPLDDEDAPGRYGL